MLVQACEANVLADVGKQMIDNWKLLAIRREANVLADAVADVAVTLRQQWLRLDACPRSIQDICTSLR